MVEIPPGDLGAWAWGDTRVREGAKAQDGLQFDNLSNISTNSPFHSNWNFGFIWIFQGFPSSHPSHLVEFSLPNFLIYLFSTNILKKSEVAEHPT